MLDERVGKPIQHENCVGRVRKSWKKSLIGIKLSSNTKFPDPTRFSIFSQILRSAKPIQHFIQHGKNAMLDEMLDWFASAFSDKMYLSIRVRTFNSLKHCHAIRLKFGDLLHP